MPDSVIFSEVIEDRRTLEHLVGYPVRGMALPFGSTDQRVTQVLRQCGIVYARTVGVMPGYQLPADFLNWPPTCHHKADLESKWAEFKQLRQIGSKLFYLWGHSWEFEGEQNWSLIEKFAAAAGSDPEIWQATNYEIYEYSTAWRSLITTVAMTAIFNPTSVRVWFRADGELMSIEPGQMIQLEA
jgi:hypothetical protein